MKTPRYITISRYVLMVAGTAVLLTACRRTPSGPVFNVEAHYQKSEFDIPMRDGVTLHTVVYIPRDTSEVYPFLIKRSPYSSGPYGENEYADFIGPTGSPRFAEEGYIIVYQDVRGRFMSEGQYLHVTPHDTTKTGPTDVDESTDTYDTVDWLVKNVQPNNGRAGLWGISYPGFYAAASIVDTHPAIVASSPQAPVGDWFLGDDFHHNGAFLLQDAFRFFTFFESPDPNPTDHWNPGFDFESTDAYEFFLDLGALRNANERYLHHDIAFWDSLMSHPNYDRFWQRRNIFEHLDNITANVMTVAGFFDAEDPYGPIHFYREIEEQNPGINNTLVLGPWFHGGWVRSSGSHLGNVWFGSATSEFYQENVDLPFFNYYLKDEGALDLPEVLAFSSGSNEWHRLTTWPPENSQPVSLFLGSDGHLTFQPVYLTEAAFDEYVSDPANPVPYTQEKRIDRSREYMVEDQRFVSGRSDVLIYQTDVLTEDVTFAGPITADLFVSTTGSDADFVVKVVDVFPDNMPEPPVEKYLNVQAAGYQMLVRGEVFRARFRNSFENPEPMTPGEITQVTFDTPDIFHTFEAGHRIMVQVQSSWFPLVDRNPQRFVNINEAQDSDFQSATHRVYHSAEYPSSLTIRRVGG